MTLTEAMAEFAFSITRNEVPERVEMVATDVFGRYRGLHDRGS